MRRWLAGPELVHAGTGEAAFTVTWPTRGLPTRRFWRNGRSVRRPIWRRKWLWRKATSRKRPQVWFQVKQVFTCRLNNYTIHTCIEFIILANTFLASIVFWEFFYFFLKNGHVNSWRCFRVNNWPDSHWNWANPCQKQWQKPELFLAPPCGITQLFRAASAGNQNGNFLISCSHVW